MGVDRVEFVKVFAHTETIFSSWNVRQLSAECLNLHFDIVHENKGGVNNGGFIEVKGSVSPC